jgi:sigma-B regulation protein RsbU (phosphoserine phosphatase)
MLPLTSSQFRTPILVVDDTKFSNALVTKTLLNAGFVNIEKSSSAMEALNLLEKMIIPIVIVDWVMPTMNGLEFTQYIRQMDQHQQRYTYIILLTAKDSGQSLYEAFAAGVDDFVHKADMSLQLAPRIYAAFRTSHLFNEISSNYHQAVTKYRALQSQAVIDYKTGVGNMNYLKLSLESILKTTFSREGFPCLIILKILNYEEIEKRCSSAGLNQLTEGVGFRLKQHCRPMDAVAHMGTCYFGIVSQRANLEQCQKAFFFKRLVDAIYFKAYPSESGYIAIQVAMRICYTQPKECLLIPKAEALIEFTMGNFLKDQAKTYLSTHELTQFYIPKSIGITGRRQMNEPHEHR